MDLDAIDKKIKESPNIVRACMRIIEAEGDQRELTFENDHLRISLTRHGAPYGSRLQVEILRESEGDGLMVFDARFAQSDVKMSDDVQTFAVTPVFDIAELTMYRSGKWEYYLMSLEEKALKAIDARYQEDLQGRFSPIDDSDIFTN